MRSGHRITRLRMLFPMERCHGLVSMRITLHAHSETIVRDALCWLSVPPAAPATWVKVHIPRDWPTWQGWSVWGGGGELKMQVCNHYLSLISYYFVLSLATLYYLEWNASFDYILSTSKWRDAQYRSTLNPKVLKGKQSVKIMIITEMQDILIKINESEYTHFMTTTVVHSSALPGSANPRLRIKGADC